MLTFCGFLKNVNIAKFTEMLYLIRIETHSTRAKDMEKFFEQNSFQQFVDILLI